MGFLGEQKAVEMLMFRRTSVETWVSTLLAASFCVSQFLLLPLAELGHRCLSNRVSESGVLDRKKSIEKAWA